MRLLQLLLLLSTSALAADFVPVQVDPARHPIRCLGMEGRSLLAAGGSVHPTVFRSHDGVRWQAQHVPKAKGPVRALWTDGHGDWVAVGGERAATGIESVDRGATWIPLSMGKLGALEALARGEDFLVAVGAGVARSVDLGDHWDVQAVSFVGAVGKVTPHLHGVVRAGGELVAVGEERSPSGKEGVVLRSEDGMRWQRLRLPWGETLESVWAEGRLMLAAGEGGTVLRSEDAGEHWLPVDVPAHADLHAIDGEPANLWIAGDDGVSLHSTDSGQSWTLQRLETRRALLTVLVLEDRVLFGTDDGFVFSSK